MNLYKRLSKNLIECQNLIGDSPDFTKREFKVKGKKYACLFYESLSSDDKVSDLLLRNLFPILEDLSFLDNIITVLQNKLTNSKICIVDRKSVVEGKSVGYSVVRGGRRMVHKTLLRA